MNEAERARHENRKRREPAYLGEDENAEPIFVEFDDKPNPASVQH